MNVTQFVNIKKYFLRVFSVERPISFGVCRTSLVLSTRLFSTRLIKSYDTLNFKESSKVTFVTP